MKRDAVDRAPPLRMIEAFEAVVRLGSRGRAAEELNVTPDAVSKQIRALERWTGRPLFDARRRAGGLTAEGRLLAEAVTGGLARIREGLEGIAAGRPAVNRLHLLAPATLAMKWLVRRLPRFEHEHPDVKVTVHPTNTGDDWQSLPHDAAIRRDIFVPVGYDSMPLFRETLGAYAAPGLVAEGRSPEDFVQCESATRPGELDRWLEAARATRIGRGRRRYTHFYIAFEAALAGEGIAVAPTVVAADDVAAGRLVAPWPQTTVLGARCALVFPERMAVRVEPLLPWLRQEVHGSGSVT
jgi:DNA-binding transcriptional LysR family regulator